MGRVRDFKPDIYLTKKDFKEIREIFHTPLTGSYNWDYTAADDKINRLYQLAKKRQWDVEIDLDWSQKWEKNKATLEEDFIVNHQSFLGYQPYLDLSDDKKLEIQKKLSAWTLSQFLHGEQGALLVASQLCSCAPTYNAKLYAATQTYDEARHVEAFNKYIQTRQGMMYPITPDLKALLDKILTDERWDLKFIGMQLVIEGLALGAFKAIQLSYPDNLLKELIQKVIQDESRHVTFGIHYLEQHIKSLSEEEKKERIQFAYEACVVMRHRFHPVEVYQDFGWNVEETIKYDETVKIRKDFQEFLFQRVIPSLKRVGLLTEDIRPKFEELGVLQWEDYDDEDIDWKEAQSA